MLDVTVRPMAREDKATHSRAFVWVKDETVMENLMNRRNRPVKLYREIAERGLIEAGIDFYQLSWSKHAGCSMCPCSPGFIVKGSTRKEIHITI
jgi:hypothetical protein